MGWVTGVAVYLIVWWVVLFAVLPWGVRMPETPEPGHMAGAPDRPHIWTKVAVTTVIAAAIWAGIYAVVASDLISFREMAREM